MGVDGSLAALCRQLNAEPLWHVSLGSKELFHSNLIGWMCERFPDEARQVLSCWLQPAEQAVASVQREYKHLDLVVRFPGFAPLVLENKMFALPDVAQLHRYLAGPVTAIVPQPTLVLLSLTDPGWVGSRSCATATGHQHGLSRWPHRSATFGDLHLASACRASPPARGGERHDEPGRSGHPAEEFHGFVHHHDRGE